MLYLAVTYMWFVYIIVNTIHLHINGYKGLSPSWQGEYYHLYLSLEVKIVWGCTATSSRLSIQTTFLYVCYSVHTFYVLHWVCTTWYFHSFTGCDNYCHVLFNILNPTSYLCSNRFDIQTFHILPTLHLSRNKQKLLLYIT